MHGFNVSSDSGNLEVALALAAAGLPIFPAELTFSEKKRSGKRNHISKGGRKKPAPTRQSCAHGGVNGRMQPPRSSSGAPT